MSSTSWGPHPLALLLALGLLGAVLHPSSAGKAQAQRANARVPGLVAQAATESDAPLELVLDRRRKQLRVIEAGRERRRYPVAIGRPGWETPVGRFAVLELVEEPVWVHPATGRRILPGPNNPLGSRWIGFLEDCTPRRGFNGQTQLVVQGCATAGFHGTPQRSSIGRAVSHGYVRLLDEHIRELFELVELGTPVTVLP